MPIEDKLRALKYWAAHFTIRDYGDVVFVDFQMYNNTKRNTSKYKTREDAINQNYNVMSHRIYELVHHMSKKKARLRNATN